MRHNFHSSKIKRLLTELDWDCGDHHHHLTSLNLIHWYPASFITAIPGNIIDIFSKPGDVVWDPFCGCGTSGIEAFRKGRIFYGNDVCEVAVLISQAKFLLIKYRSQINKQCEKIVDGLNQLNYEMSFSVSSNDYFESGKESCSYDELKSWYHPKTLRELLVLNGFLKEKMLGKKFWHFFLTIFLNIARIACAQQKTWGHIADNVLPNKTQIDGKEYPVISSFLNRLSTVQEKASKLLVISKNGDFYIRAADARTYLPRRPVDLVITSPPYPSMSDYVTSQRLDYYWLGYSKEDINTLKKKEIGPRYLRHNKSKNILYFDNMKQAIDNIVKRIKHEGYLVLIMPEYDASDPRKEVIDKCYAYLDSLIKLSYQIPRKVDEMNRWAPFRKLKMELLTVWSKQ